jgi:hypothetical protein
MRRHLFLLTALLCLSTRAMAQDPCSELNTKVLSVNANGHTFNVAATIGLYTTQQANGTYTFAATDDSGKSITGQCSGRHITFTRGSGSTSQFYDGWMFEKILPNEGYRRMAGFFSVGAGAKQYGWHATIGPTPP